MRATGIVLVLSLAACSQVGSGDSASKPSAQEQQAIADAEAMIANHPGRIESRVENTGEPETQE